MDTMDTQAYWPHELTEGTDGGVVSDSVEIIDGDDEGCEVDGHTSTGFDDILGDDCEPDIIMIGGHAIFGMVSS